MKDGLEQKAIPYHEEFSNQIVKIMTAKEVLEKIEKDLLAAYTLLEEDPVKHSDVRIMPTWKTKIWLISSEGSG